MSPVSLLELCSHYRIGKGARSSRAERPAHNRLVGGSNPPGPTTAYGRFRRLRDVARQPVGAPRTRDTRSVAVWD